MRITKVNIPQSYNFNGIEDIKMERLGKVVLVVGKNGSGKTRLLEKVANALNQKLSTKDFDEKKLEISRLNRKITDIKSNIIELKRKISGSNDFLDIKYWTDEIAINRDIIEKIKKEIDNLNLQMQLVETTEIRDKYPYTYYVPIALDLADCNNFGRGELISSANSVKQLGFENLSKGTFALIQHLQDLWVNATHQESKINKDEKEKAVKDYQNLNNIIKSFFKEEIQRDLLGNATLFGFPLGRTNLSNGQKIILQFCVALFSQNTFLNELILFMDEPENHLHPSVLIEIIERISEYLTDGQIWIATHSIPLIAHFDSNSIWYMEAGDISFAGKIPEKVLDGLLGSEDEINKLQDFIGLPAQLALNQFAYECLFEPHSIITGKDDPQVRQIIEMMQTFENQGKIKILDYGAGKGRLLANIIENSTGGLQNFTDRYDYIAFDKYDYGKIECENLLAQIYQSSSNRYFNEFSKLVCNHSSASFDIVLMSNVFHEIDPKEWLKLFNKDGLVSSLLAENGVLILVEDTEVPIGEKPYQNGFIVLDTPELEELFNTKQHESINNFISITDARGDGRLKCHSIPRFCLEKINEDSRKKALKTLQRRALENILSYRRKEKNYKNGKLHGFWVQQLANVTLALSELTTQ